ncbi:hypothetical protein H0H93_005803 [Arthromyces matolae]|nr:hypothetical protein H0H93_005803 [Arthromyces matolae]
MDQDVDMDAPQISTLKDEESPPPQPKASTSGRRTATSPHKSPAVWPRPRQTENLTDDEYDEVEEEEDQLIDDEDDLMKPVPAAALSSRSGDSPKKKSPSKRKPRKSEKRVVEDETTATNVSGKLDLAPTVTWFETTPAELHDADVSQSASAPVGLPISETPKKATKKAVPPRTKMVPTKLKTALPILPDDLGGLSEAPSGTAASSPVTLQFDIGTPEPEESNPAGSAAMMEEINLENVALPQYPLPTKPFPVQQASKIPTGFAPVLPLDKSQKKVRHWREAKREIRGIAGGRWFAKTWVGGKDSEYASSQPKAGEERMSGIIALPRLAATSVSAPVKGKGKAKAVSSLAASAAPSRSGSSAPDLLAPNARPKTKMRNIVTAPALSEDSDMAEARRITPPVVNVLRSRVRQYLQQPRYTDYSCSLLHGPFRSSFVLTIGSLADNLLLLAMTQNSPTVPSVTGPAANVTKSSALISARANERAAAQQAFASDPKYKKFTQQIEKCLNSFDNVHEWADFIAFLKQLLKQTDGLPVQTFQSYMQFKEIPRKLIVSKRLSQCLNPALPTGVHQRALDVYLHILSVLGPDGLLADISIWSSGLFPFFEYAATSVKPTLLNLFDTHYLPLQSGLRPVMKSFILALLPGLEEETSEFFDKVLNMLDRLSGTVSPSFFFQNIWLVMLTTPTARGTALNYLARRLPRLNPEEGLLHHLAVNPDIEYIADITEFVGKDIGLMIRAFAAALEDENLLVRRGALDLLLQSLRVDSLAVRKAKAEDRAILMTAATGVVLRRDLSLNRRLYTWLLGTDEKSEKQVEYLKLHALDLVYSTLKNEMSSPSGEYSESRPFKIFISLLDKWEIGAALSQVLVYDAFKALKNLVEHPSDAAEDVTMTASTLYEAVEPHILWKRLLAAVFNEISGGQSDVEATRMVHFILKTFAQDDEMQTIHLPIIFTSILDLINVTNFSILPCVSVLNLHMKAQFHNDPLRISSTLLRETLLLQEEVLRHIPHSSLMQQPQLTIPDQVRPPNHHPYLFACAFYGIDPISLTVALSDSVAIPFISAFGNLANFALNCTRALATTPSDTILLREVLSLSFSLLDKLSTRLSTPVTLSWNADDWFQVILEGLEHESANFTTVDRTISFVVSLHQNAKVTPRPVIDKRPTMLKMINKLLGYLHTNYAPYHVRVVNLIWSLQAVTSQSHIEAIIAHAMTSPGDSRSKQESFEAFGVLWRLTGFRFKVPMMIVLESLNCDDPSLRRIGETWMRCSLKSYLRILDPILFELLDPAMKRSPSIAKVHGKELQIFLYERPFNQSYMNHLLDLLLSIIRFGGQGFAKTAKATPIRRSHHTSLVQRIEQTLPDPDATYLDALVDIVLRFIQSEPSPSQASIMLPKNAILQSTAVDLLQAIVARGDVDGVAEGIEPIVLGKLFLCVHWNRLDLQNKLLHLLHSLISAATSHDPSSRQIVNRHDGGGTTSSNEGDIEQLPRQYSVNSLLIQTLVDGIAVRTNRPVLQHWLDFILMAVPQFQPALQAVVSPLNDCLCRQLSLSLKDIHSTSSQARNFNDDWHSSVTDAEMIMLLNGLERMVLLSLAYPLEASSTDDESLIQDKVPTEGSGLLGYVSNVFGSESMQQISDETLTARSPAYKSLNDGIRVLYSIWATLIWNRPPAWSHKDDSLSLFYSRTRIRCRRVLEHLFRVQAMEVFESVVDCWSRGPASDAAFELVDVLVASAQNARLEGPIAIQVWNRFLQLVKDITGSTRDFKIHHFAALNCLTVLAEKITQTTAMEDRRIRKELQDNFGKLLDLSVAFVGRSYDQGSWIRRSTKESLVATNGRNSPAPAQDIKSDEKQDASTLAPPDSAKPAAPSELVVQITDYLASSVLPNLRKFLIDNDKILSACNNIIYYVVNPAMRGRTRPLDVDPPILAILKVMARISSSLKAWKTPVTELLYDNRLFNCNGSTAEPWMSILKTLFDADKSAFPELLSKVATAPSANIFTNREYEMLLRSINVRRLSLILFAGEKNHFLTQLPTIQEKLVDIFRNVTAPIVQCEVFLCIRVLLCRLSAHNMTSFWPVLLTELYRIFEQVMSALPADGSEDLQLILAASKCLDLLLVLQTEEFQIHQWIFVTDTVDAIYRPDNWFPEAMMDQLAEIAGALPVGDGVNGVPTPNLPATFPDQRPLRRPMLNSLRQIESIRDLIPFFSNVSISSYESVYASGGNVDWEAVEEGILEDMFDGR